MCVFHSKKFHSKSETCIMYTFIPHRLIYFKCLFILILMIITDNYSFPVAQLVEHGASNAKIMGSIPGESKT